MRKTLFAMTLAAMLAAPTAMANHGIGKGGAAGIGHAHPPAAPPGKAVSSARNHGQMGILARGTHAPKAQGPHSSSESATRNHGQMGMLARGNHAPKAKGPKSHS
jgi:hypothetical protein